MINPFEQINERLDKIESLLNQLGMRKVRNQDEMITRKEITKQYKLSYGTIHNAMNKGELNFIKVGRKTLYKRTEVEKWLS